MGALAKPRPSNEPTRKPPVKETSAPKLDQYGRDPNSPAEVLRRSTDYDKGTGYSAFPNAALADIVRLSSGAVCYSFVLWVNHLTWGQNPRREWSLPISAAELAERCRANVRDIQRQLSELEDRGMISVKTIKNGTVKYSISLLYSKWRELEDYAVWKRRQVVEIDSAETETETEDDEQTPVSKDAVTLFKRPAVVRPGRASRATRVNVGVREVVCQNDSPTVDAAFSAVVQSGRLVVSATFKTGESEAKGEDKGNAERHACRALPPNEGSKQKRSKGETHPRAAEIVNIFDPLLMKSGSRLLSPDESSLQKACAELGALPHDALLYFVMKPGGRGARPISSPAAVASIVREARQNWEADQRQHAKARPTIRCKCGGEVMDVQSGLCARCLS